MNVSLGVDVGQRHEASGLCVVEVEERRFGDTFEHHYLVRQLLRWAESRSFPVLAEEVGRLAQAIERRTGQCPMVYVDVTHLGDRVVHLIEEELPGGLVHPVYFNHGDRRVVDRDEIRLGKAWLVTHLQTLLQCSQLHLVQTPEAVVLAQELLDYTIKGEPDAHERCGSFRVGRYDELVTALGLAVQEVPQHVVSLEFLL
jgi:hypothetical protein